MIYSVIKKVVLLVICLSATQAYAEADFSRTFFTVGRYHGHNSLSIGGRTNSFGLEVGAYFQNDFPTEYTIDSKPPDSNYVSIGEKYDNAYGFDALWLGNTQYGWSFFVGPGLYLTKHATFVRSNTDGLIYNLGYSIEYDLAGSTGIIYSPHKNLSIGLGFHSIRGPNLSFGLRF